VPDRRYHHGSHQRLLWKPDGPLPTGRSPDAIVVPTHRKPSYLTAAGELASALRCTLVTLHSGRATTADSAMDLLSADVERLAIDVHSADLRLPSWKTSELLASNSLLASTDFRRRSDLSAKRNLALMLSRMRGWSRILLVDDDITGLHPEQIRQAVGLLDTHNAVGLQIQGFPDHSVVCHAYRLAGGCQLSFIGGGALAIEVERCNSFFPDIYNDDWFFMLDSKGRLQPIAQAGQVLQESFDPFVQERAQDEELGEVLAEGLYWLLDQGAPVSAANHEHWAGFLTRRRRFIGKVQGMVNKDVRLSADEKKHRVAALEASLSRLEQISPDLCEAYLRAWVSDREDWRRHVSTLPAGLSLPQAVRHLTVPSGKLVWRWAEAAR
jgi:hypothetical protein